MFCVAELLVVELWQYISVSEPNPYHHHPAGLHTLPSHTATVTPLTAPSVDPRLQSFPLRQGTNEHVNHDLTLCYSNVL